MPKQPPKAWWDKMYKKVKDGNPSYSDERLRKTVGDIWYNKMSPSKKKKEVKKEGTFSHSFTPEFYDDLANELEVMWELDRDGFVDMVQDLMPGYLDLPADAEERAVYDYLPDTLIHDLVQKAVEVDTVTDLRSPVEVWLDPEGFHTVHVARVTKPQLRVSGERVPVIQARVAGERVVAQGTGFLDNPNLRLPELFSSKYKNYIITTVQSIAASNSAEAANTEMVRSNIQGAINEVKTALAIAAQNEVDALLTTDEIDQIAEAVRPDLLDSIDVDKSDMLPPGVEAPPAPGPSLEPPAAPQIPEPMEQPMMGASVKVPMSHKLRVAFAKSAGPEETALLSLRDDQSFLEHLVELEEQAENVEELAEFLKEYVLSRMGPGMAPEMPVAPQQLAPGGE